MNEKNQITLFRDPLDPRELSFGLSQPHTEPSLTSGTGQARNQFMKNENQILGGDRTLRQSMKSIKQDLAEWVKDQQVLKAVSSRDVTHAHYGTPCSKIECNPRLTREEQIEFSEIKHSHQGDATWRRYLELVAKAEGRQ